MKDEKNKSSGAPADKKQVSFILKGINNAIRRERSQGRNPARYIEFRKKIIEQYGLKKQGVVTADQQ